MTDYSSSSVWDAEGGGMIALDALPLSEPTKRRLEAWGARLWEFLDEEDALACDVDAAQEADAAQDAEGRCLWRLVSTELGDEWQVGYAVFESDPDGKPGATRRILWN